MIIAIFGIVVGYLVSEAAYTNFINTGVTPNLAAGYSFGIFVVILGAFGLVAVRVNL